MDYTLAEYKAEEVRYFATMNLVLFTFLHKTPSESIV